MSDIPKIFTQEVDYNTTSLNLARAQKQLRRDYAVLARSPSIVGDLSGYFFVNFRDKANNIIR